MFVGAFVGIMPMLYVNLGTSIIAYFLNSYFSGKFLGYSSWMQIKDIAPSYGIAVAVALSIWFFKYLPISYWVVLPIQVIVGTCVFFLLCKLFKLEEYQETKKIVFPFLAKLRKK